MTIGYFRLSLDRLAAPSATHANSSTYTTYTWAYLVIGGNLSTLSPYRSAKPYWILPKTSGSRSEGETMSETGPNVCFHPVRPAPGFSRESVSGTFDYNRDASFPEIIAGVFQKLPTLRSVAVASRRESVANRCCCATIRCSSPFHHLLIRPSQ